MSWAKFLWSWDGRLNRLQFLLGCHGLGLVTILVSYILLPTLAAEDMVGAGYRVTERVSWVMTLSALPALPFQASMMVRRLHDLNRSGRIVVGLFAAACLVPLAIPVPDGYRAFFSWLGLLLGLVFLWMVLAPGVPTANNYGPAPAAGWWP